jgi:hypothetical protein
MTAMATLTVVAPPVASETISVATPSPAGGTPGPSVIYSTGETGDFSAWTVSEGWSAELGLHATGDGDGGWAIPPVTVTETQDYAVEIDFVLLESHECPRNFGVAIRGSEAGYYAAGIDWDCDQMAVLWAGQNRLESHSLSLDQSLHVLRIEAIGDRITYSIDGRVLIEATDATYPTGGEIGIWANGVAISITAFRIYDLTASTNGG